MERRIFRVTMMAAAMAWLTMMWGCAGSQLEAGVNDFFEKLTPPTPTEVAKQAVNQYDADQRRRAVTMLANANWGGAEPYVKLYRLLSDDADPTVRSASMAALGMHGDASDVPMILTHLSEDNKSVRWEAVKALQRIHNDVAVGPLIQALRDDEDVDVRMAAATALGQYREVRVFDAMVGALDDADYGVVVAAGQSLATLTGQELGTEASKWLAWSKQAGSHLFADAKTYYYPQYEAPRTLIDKAMFWQKEEPMVQHEPRGMATENSDTEPSG